MTILGYIALGAIGLAVVWMALWVVSVFLDDLCDEDDWL